MDNRVIIMLITWIAGLKGFGPETCRHLKNGLKKANITREPVNFCKEIEELYVWCMKSVRIGSAMLTMKTAQTAGGLTGLSVDRIHEMVLSVAAWSKVLIGRLLEACSIAVTYYKLGPLGYTFLTQTENVETDRGGHPDLIIQGPLGHSYMIEFKTTASTLYKVPLFEHTEYPFYLVLLGATPYDLSDAKIQIMHRFGCQPVVITSKYADKAGVMTYDEMIAEIRKDEGPEDKEAEKLPKTAHA